MGTNRRGRTLHPSEEMVIQCPSGIVRLVLRLSTLWPFLRDLSSLRFLASTHYTHYNPWLFAINLTALTFVLLAKLPQVDMFFPHLHLPFLISPIPKFHRQRFHFLLGESETSSLATPVTPTGSFTPTRFGDSVPPIRITEAQFQ